MYTRQRTEIGKLRKYRVEIAALYESALKRHDEAEAHRLYDLLRRVRRAILIHEEFNTSPEPAMAHHLRHG